MVDRRRHVTATRTSRCRAGGAGVVIDDGVKFVGWHDVVDVVEAVRSQPLDQIDDPLGSA
jgi:hypothetical protein